jgi:FkbM family methyltransferase
MGLVFKLVKGYKRFLFSLSSRENPIYLSYYKLFYKPKPGSVADYLNQFSKKNYPITFLQIGANDGFIYDPLHKFIKRDNWKGIMLEPQPHVYNKFLVKLHAKRPEIKPINVALDKTDGTRTLYKLAISNERWATGLSSFDKERLLNKLSEKWFLRHVRRQGITLPVNVEEIVIAQEIDTISPETLLKMFDNCSFNLLAIDTEGFDFEILKMLDLGRISPSLILYEEGNFDEKTIQECRAYLQKHGYSCLSINKDVIATKN